MYQFRHPVSLELGVKVAACKSLSALSSGVRMAFTLNSTNEVDEHEGYEISVVCARDSFGIGDCTISRSRTRQRQVRTDYNSQTEGTSSNPITYISPCLFPLEICGNSPTVFSANNWFSQNVAGYPQSNFWVLDFNNEPAYNRGGQTTNNPGPPNQSIPRSSPGYGLMGFTAIKDTPAGENFYRAHLVMNGTFPNPKYDATPFMAVGAERDRGNAGLTPGYINSGSGIRKVQFKAKLWGFTLPKKFELSPGVPDPDAQKPSLVFNLVAITEWGGKKRGLQVSLAHWLFDNSTLSTFDAQYKWNWPMQESFYHSGAEWAFIDAEDVFAHCGFPVSRLTTIGQQISYDINLHNLFRCLGSSTKNGWDAVIPTTQVLNITGVHWAVEMTGDKGALWTSVHDMKMMP